MMMVGANIPVVNVRLDEEGMILNDSLLPSQFWGELKRTGTSPEMRLVSAILVDAVNCYLGRNRNRKAHAFNWFSSSSPHPFSFLDCCAWLDIDSESFWEKLKVFAAEGRKVKRVNGHLVESDKFRPFAWR